MDLKVPFVAGVAGYVINPGSIITVTGTVPQSSSWFAINLQTGPSITPRSDIALHINPRFQNQVLVRNSLIDQQWGIEENNGNFPFVPGVDFEVKIYVDQSHYKIAINGQHYTEFNHRIPINYVNTVAVDGEVHLRNVEGVEPTRGGPPPYPTAGGIPSSSVPPGMEPYPISGAGSSYPVSGSSGAGSNYPMSGGTATGAYPGGPPSQEGDKGMFGLSTGQMVVGGLGAAGAAYLGTKLGKKAMKKMKKGKKFKKGKHKRSSSSSSSSSSGSSGSS